MSAPTGEGRRGIVILPAHDEAASLPDVLEELRRAAPLVEALVVDDGSADGTAEAAARAGARVLRHPFWLGYGAALQTGFKHALAEGYGWVVTMDADGQHDPESIARLVEPVEAGTADIAVGSRFLHDPGFPTGLAKRLALRFFRGVYRLLARQAITDPTSGFRCLSRRAFRFCTLDLYPHDYPDTDLLITLHKAGLRIVEVPARMRERKRGVSMHAGLAGRVYYLFKVSVSILATLFRQSHAYLDELPEGSPTVRSEK